MNPRLARALPVVLALAACKPRPPQTPSDEAASEPGQVYGEAAYASSVQPIEVCEHLARLAASEAGFTDPQIDPSMMAECERELGLEAAARGTDNWNGLAGCVLQAKSEADIDACDRSYPMPSSSAAPPAGDGSRERAVCEHMLEVIMLEAAAELGEVPQVSDAEQRQLEDECAGALNEERTQLNPADYEALLRCIELAQTGAQMQVC